MKLKHIHIENYKTYRELDLSLEVGSARPIILVGGMNGCGKTTLFDAIYHALYGLEIHNERQFEELFNAGKQLEVGLEDQKIVLELSFIGKVNGKDADYKMRRSYMLLKGKIKEVITLDMEGLQFTCGSGRKKSDNAIAQGQINNLIAGNLPAELSNYFLFDAMKTSELVKEGQINTLILENIKSVMGFNKYHSMYNMAKALLEERTAERMENEKLKEEYIECIRLKNGSEEELATLKKEYSTAIEYANEHKEEYEQLKDGRNADEVRRDQMLKLRTSIEATEAAQKEYKKKLENVVQNLEVEVIYPKIATTLATEIELIIHNKKEVETSRAHLLSEKQIKVITAQLVKFITDRNENIGHIDTNELVNLLKTQQEASVFIDDKYPFLSNKEVSILSDLVSKLQHNPFIALSNDKEQLEQDIETLPLRKKQLEELERGFNGNDYSFIEEYEVNQRKMSELKEKLRMAERKIKELEQKVSTYDLDMSQEADPGYDLLCRLPDVFKRLSEKLLHKKKSNIEQMMRDQLNQNLIIYSGVIGRVELSGKENDKISFKVFHKSGNEIHLNQLNAGAKQTVMQVLLKVLYNLGDYEPPVMIDTVMGVLDKQSRDTIIEHYFPDLAHQTILLSTDTEITAEHDFEKLQPYIAQTYTLHRDKERQCTTVTNDYFGLKVEED